MARLVPPHPHPLPDGERESRRAATRVRAHQSVSYAAWRLLPVFCNADHTVCAVTGMVKFSEPIALVMALITAGRAAIAPAPPQPLMPSGLPGRLVIAVPTLELGRACPRGMPQCISHPVTGWAWPSSAPR